MLQWLINLRTCIFSSDRNKKITSFELNKNLATFYIWLPLILTAYSYFYPIDRKFFVVGGYFFIAIALFLFLSEYRLSIKNNAILRIFFLYIILIACSIAVLSNNSLHTLWFLFAYVGLPFFIGMSNSGHLGWRSMLVNYSLLAVVVFFVFIENLLDGFHQRVYVFGSPSNSIQLSLVSAFFISHILFDFRKDRGECKIFSVFSFFLGLFLGGILPRWFILATFAIFFLAIFLIRYRETKRLSILTFFLGWILALFLFDGRADFYFGNLLPRFPNIQTDPHVAITSIEERIRFILTSIDIFLNNPFFGVGSGNFGFASGGELYSFPHMSYFHIMAEMGLIMLVLYIFMIGYGGVLLVIAIKADPGKFPFLAIFLYGIVFSLLHGNYLTDKLVYFGLGYAASLAFPTKESMEV